MRANQRFGTYRFIVLGHNCESGKIDESFLFVYSENENGHTTTLKILDIHTFEVSLIVKKLLLFTTLFSRNCW